MGRLPAEDEAIYLRGVRAIHTCFMRVPIDVAFLDARGAVLRVLEQVPPGRLVRGPREAAACLELPAGSIRGRALAEVRLIEENGRMVAHLVPAPPGG